MIEWYDYGACLQGASDTRGSEHWKVVRLWSSSGVVRLTVSEAFFLFLTTVSVDIVVYCSVVGGLDRGNIRGGTGGERLDGRCIYLGTRHIDKRSNLLERVA